MRHSVVLAVSCVVFFAFGQTKAATKSMYPDKVLDTSAIEGLCRGNDCARQEFFAADKLLAAATFAQQGVQYAPRGAWAGVSVSDIAPDRAKAFGLDKTRAIIDSVNSKGPADEAGIKPGDVIRSIDGKEIADSTALLSTIAAKTPGTRIRVNVWRNGQSHELTLTLGEHTLEQPPAQAAQSQSAPAKRFTKDSPAYLQFLLAQGAITDAEYKALLKDPKFKSAEQSLGATYKAYLAKSKNEAERKDRIKYHRKWITIRGAEAAKRFKKGSPAYVQFLIDWATHRNDTLQKVMDGNAQSIKPDGFFDTLDYDAIPSDGIIKPEHRLRAK